jgi:hypothetical protein
VHFLAVLFEELEQREGLITKFEEEIWNAIIEVVKVHSEDEITFIFKDGMELD